MTYYKAIRCECGCGHEVIPKTPETYWKAVGTPPSRWPHGISSTLLTAPPSPHLSAPRCPTCGPT